MQEYSNLRTAHLVKLLHAVADPIVAQKTQRFFKTGKGQYSDEDQFLGITVPTIRQLVKPYCNLPMNNVVVLLKSPFHEIRFAAVIICITQFKKATESKQQEIFNFYINNSEYVNNWDIVDISAPHIVGAFLYNKNKQLLYDLVQSPLLWQRRISIVATLYLIKRGDTQTTYELAVKLLEDPEDLLHKATGWMLREAGKTNKKELVVFLKHYGKCMPRTMLRYAIEKFSKEERINYMQR